MRARIFLYVCIIMFKYVLIPIDCTRVILVDRRSRARARVNADKPFVFAYTKQSSDDTTGYNEIMSVCHLIDIPVITATEVRHQVVNGIVGDGEYRRDSHQSLYGAYGPFQEH